MQVFELAAVRRLSGRQALVASLVGAAFTAICAQVAFYIPGKPIPITMQVFAVVCCALVLGGRLAALAQLEYLAAGVAGAPLFATVKAGPAALVGPAGGYLVGFVAAAFVAGCLFERAPRSSFASACSAGIVGVGVIYLFGVAWLAAAYGSAFPGIGAWVVGAAPFAGIDAVKVVLASLLFARGRAQ